MIRRFAAFGSMALACTAFAALLTPMPPAAADRTPQPILLSNVRGSWLEGNAKWVSLTWTASDEIENLRVVATSDQDLVISYPPETITFSSLTNGNDLAANEIDTTRIYVATTTATPPAFRIDLQVTWEVQGEPFEGTAHLWNEVLPYPSSETAFALLTNATSVPAEGDGRRNWIGLQYLGISAVASKVEIQVTGDLPIHYPQGNFTSLHHDAVLEPDEIDTARVWIDPQRIEPGTYDLEVATSYTIDGVGRTMRRTLTVTVI